MTKTKTTALLLSLGLFTAACGEAGEFDGGMDDTATDGGSDAGDDAADAASGDGDGGVMTGGGSGDDGNDGNGDEGSQEIDCDDGDCDDDAADGVPVDFECEGTEVLLVAGQHYDAGWVTATITDEGLLIEVDAAAPWRLHMVHVHASRFAPAPNPGSYPWSAELDYADGYSMVVPFDELRVSCGDLISVAVHAEVSKPITEDSCLQETAWGEGEFSFDVGWGSYFEVPMCCD